VSLSSFSMHNNSKLEIFWGAGLYFNSFLIDCFESFFFPLFSFPVSLGVETRNKISILLFGFIFILF